MMKYINLGCGNSFDPLKFVEPKNRPKFCKPWGGLWGSPENSKFGWERWCEMEGFRIERNKESRFKFTLDPDAKIYVINSIPDLLAVPYKIRKWEDEDLIDFEKMALEYDAIFLTVKGEQETRFSWESGMSLYGWDCESILVLKKEKIRGI